ncbi:ferric reductase-like transmembrane domain-containing protein [Roseibacterium sp. SDUM158016]|jgi:sulfoxide reductase heme-binding subunit YedZ|uniref:sulfite oxidase heme-binding subunit YedZ n=1 Tax=Roseicyclus sediminis TaxID=2980997 RepID=UPI0021D3AA4D|nr:ferric reductase-like transmembrane domain-containing protein [Roseibacterium sp. SDUM158016]MCU4652517.1 ferric reductase-like transmembrane domain-containing protein [Roseibacterium sp. SDUM158016]
MPTSRLSLSPYWLWAILVLPPLYWSWQALTSTNPQILGILLHPTGEWAARLMIVALLASPLRLLLKGWRGPAWLCQNRRYFGVASFGYALLHTVIYLADKGSLDRILLELDWTYIWTGWVAFLVMVPLAMTSMDAAQRVMGRHWKTLQRATYVAAVFTLLHWAALHRWEHPEAALVHFAPLAILEAYRIWYWTLRRRPPPASAT